MKKQFLLVGVVVMVGLGVFLWSCTDSGKEDEDFEDETNLSAPVLRIGGPYNCDILEWDLIEGAEKYNLLESESRAELERINRPAYNSNTGGQYLSYGALYQNYLTLCDKAFNRGRTIYYVVFAVGKSENDYRKSNIISYHFN